MALKGVAVAAAAEGVYDLMWMLAPAQAAVPTAAKLHQALRTALLGRPPVELDAVESSVFSRRKAPVAGEPVRHVQGGSSNVEMAARTAYLSVVPYEIRWDTEPEDVMIVFTGRLPMEELLAAFDELRAAPQYQRSLRFIQDQRAVDWTQLSADDIRQRAEAIVGYTAPDETHVVAVVVDRALGFGLTRMRHAHIAGRIATIDRVFYDLESARAWLRAFASATE